MYYVKIKWAMKLKSCPCLNSQNHWSLSHVKHYVHIILLENEVTSTCKDHNLCPLTSPFFFPIEFIWEPEASFCDFPPSTARTPNALPKKKKDRETLSSSSIPPPPPPPRHFLCDWLSSMQTWPPPLAFWRAPGYAEAGVCCLVCSPPEPINNQILLPSGTGESPFLLIVPF